MNKIFGRFRSISLTAYLGSIILFIGLDSSANMAIVNHISFILMWCYLLGCATSGQGMPILTRQQDELLGAYSYPFYLLHYHAWILGSYLYHDLTPKITLTAVLALLIILSSFTIFCIEKPIEKIRIKVRKCATPLPSQSQSLS